MAANDFQKQLAIGQEYENAVANWLRRERDFFVYPACGGPKAGDFRGPAMVRGSSVLTLPDLLAAKNNEMTWFEVKEKERADLHRNSGNIVTGLALRHWLDYCAIKKETGSRVFIIFVHQQENEVRTAEIDNLKVLINHQYSGGKMDNGGMIFFKFHRLHYLMTVTELMRHAN